MPRLEAQALPPQTVDAPARQVACHAATRPTVRAHWSRCRHVVTEARSQHCQVADFHFDQPLHRGVTRQLSPGHEPEGRDPGNERGFNNRIGTSVQFYVVVPFLHDIVWAREGRSDSENLRPDQIESQAGRRRQNLPSESKHWQDSDKNRRFKLATLSAESGSSLRNLNTRAGLAAATSRLRAGAVS